MTTVSNIARTLDQRKGSSQVDSVALKESSIHSSKERVKSSSGNATAVAGGQQPDSAGIDFGLGGMMGMMGISNDPAYMKDDDEETSDQEERQLSLAEQAHKNSLMVIE